MVKNLAERPRDAGRDFGLKLSNTLEVVNHRPVFPPNEKMMYLSGRALHPLTLTLARLVDDELDGRGADQLLRRRRRLELRRPGRRRPRAGHRLHRPPEARRLRPAPAVPRQPRRRDDRRRRRRPRRLRRGHLRRAGRALEPRPPRRAGRRRRPRSRYARRERPLVFKGERPLGPFDCIAAPCLEACPAHQNIPDYLWQVAHGRHDEALEVILRTNPLPGVTGSICDHPCTERCVRNFYDAPLAIREIKRFAFEHGGARPEHAGRAEGREGRDRRRRPGRALGRRAWPDGLRAELFEAKSHAGGMVGGVVPRYRLADDSSEVDLDRLRRWACRSTRHGRRPGRHARRAARRASPTSSSASARRRASGSASPARTPTASSTRSTSSTASAPGVTRPRQADPRHRRRQLRHGRRPLGAAPRRPTARSPSSTAAPAPRCRPTRRRSATARSRASSCGTSSRPARVVVENGRVVGLACTRMKLGEPDASGRPRPVPLGGSEVVLPADTIIPAIGQEPVLDFLGGPALDAKRRRHARRATPRRRDLRPGLFAGGDVVRGPASVIKAIADGRAAAEEIGRRHGVAPGRRAAARQGAPVAALMEKKARLVRPEHGAGAAGRRARRLRRGRPLPRPRGGAPRGGPLPRLRRPLQPLRHRLPEPREPRLRRRAAPDRAARRSSSRRGAPSREGTTTARGRAGVQIVNVGDFCNECGNCTTFCPTSGAPYRDKPRFWIDRGGLRRGEGRRLPAGPRRRDRRDRGADRRPPPPPRAPGRRRRVPLGPLHATLDPVPWTSRRPRRWAPAEGDVLDLGACALLIALLHAEPALPPLSNILRRRRRHLNRGERTWQTRTASTRSTRSCRPRG